MASIPPCLSTMNGKRIILFSSVCTFRRVVTGNHILLSAILAQFVVQFISNIAQECVRLPISHMTRKPVPSFPNSFFSTVCCK